MLVISGNGREIFEKISFWNEIACFSVFIQKNPQKMQFTVGLSFCVTEKHSDC